MIERRSGQKRRVIPQPSMTRDVTSPKLVVLIPESTRKAKGGDPNLPPIHQFLDALPKAQREGLQALREEVEKAWRQDSTVRPLMSAYRRYQGNMYRRISRRAWEVRAPEVEVLIVSGLLGIVASQDTVPAYPHSMAETTEPFGKLNRWWQNNGLPEILKAYMGRHHPPLVVDLLSQEYRKSVEGY